MLESIRIDLTDGALKPKNGYISLTNNMNFFPAECLSTKGEQPRKLLKIELPTGEIISTYVLKKYNRFQHRFGGVFKSLNIKSGATAIVSKRSNYDYLLEFKNPNEEITPNEALLSENQYVSRNNFLDESKYSDLESIEDYKVQKAIITRRGQPKFRKALLSFFNGHCCISGSSVKGVLEAAHIIPHAEESDYKVTNGLLLRADLHTLYDLNLIGIDGEGAVHLSDDLKGSEYAEYAGQRISDDELPKELSNNLQQRFEKFQSVN